VQVFAQAFWAQKAGNAVGEYEDAFWPRKTLESQEGNEFRFAVADGATETSFSGVWAKQLVRLYCSGRVGTSCTGFLTAMRLAQQRWYSVLARRPLPWYAEEKVRAGAFSALLGLRLLGDDSYSGGGWQATAMGDCCLVQMRGDDIIARFPIERACDFNNRPILLSSNPDHNGEVGNSLRFKEGKWISDDSFYLMTDALAAWFLATAEQGERPWSIIRDLQTSEQTTDFRQLVHHLRVHKLLRNDDVTLIRIDVVSSRGAAIGLA